MRRPGPCNPACTAIVKFMTNLKIPPNVGRSIGGYKKIDGYRYINIFVQFSQHKATEPPVDLGVVFALQTNGQFGARCYVNLEENLASSQSTSFIDISGGGRTFHGSPYDISSYLVRLPVMGPYVQVFPYNRARVERTVSIWGYLVS